MKEHHRGGQWDSTGRRTRRPSGRAATHGCMRLHDEDIEWMYLNVPVGTLVFI